MGALMNFELNFLTFIGLSDLGDWKLLQTRLYVVSAQIFINVFCITELLDSFVNVDKSITTLAFLSFQGLVCLTP